MRLWQAAFAAGVSCLSLGVVGSAVALPAMPGEQPTNHELHFAAASDDLSFKGRGILAGPGRELGADRLLPVEPPDSTILAQFRYDEDGLGGKGPITLRVRSAHYFRNGTISQSLRLSVEVTDSTDPDCREATATRSGVRGTVVLTENASGTTIELDLPCGVHRSWTEEGSRVVSIEYGEAGGTTKTAPSSTTTKPAVAGAFPGGTATKLTFKIGSTTVTTDLKTNTQTPDDPVINAKSGTVLAGSVSINGTLPKGWHLVVFHLSADDILLNTATGGSFSGIKPISTGFDGSTRPAVYVCSTKAPPLCSPAAQADISISWKP
jgi:hypothetical protein